MLRFVVPVVALIVLAESAAGQSRGCIERPVGPGMDVTVLVPVPGGPSAPQRGTGQPPARAAVTVPNQPMYGTECIAVAPPPRDILRGEPAPAGGLLRGDDGRQDLLRDPSPARPPTGWR